MPRFRHWEWSEVPAGARIAVRVSDRCNVRLMRDWDYDVYRSGTGRYSYHGGVPEQQLTHLRIPESGAWHLCVDLAGFPSGHKVREVSAHLILPTAAELGDLMPAMCVDPRSIDLTLTIPAQLGLAIERAAVRHRVSTDRILLWALARVVVEGSISKRKAVQDRVQSDDAPIPWPSDVRPYDGPDDDEETGERTT